MSFKRPIIRRAAHTHTEFTTEIRANGTRVSSWGPPVHKPRIVSGTPGVVGSIVDKMRRGDDYVLRPYQKPWTPPSEYEFIAKQLPVGEREAYLTRCQEWFAAHPPATIKTRVAPKEYDGELLSALYQNKEARPPLAERVKVYRAAGYSEEYIEKAKARDKRWRETKAERDAAFDLIFAKWPSASKPTPKTKKVIKAVKKRMNP
jgi:hypothetical protein